jgi:hypothetical protein
MYTNVYIYVNMITYVYTLYNNIIICIHNKKCKQMCIFMYSLVSKLNVFSHCI